MAPRSYLFVPGDRQDMLDRAATRGADALIADLEDGVAPARRSAARTAVARWLGGGSARPETWVRLDSNEPAPDVAAVEGAAIAGVVLPKVQSIAEIEHVAELLTAAEADAGRPPGSIAVMPLIETAAALAGVNAIAAAPRVKRLMIGEMDLGAELGIHHEDEELWLPIRLQLVVASAAAGLPGPVGPVARDFTDLEGLRDTTRRLRRTGFTARAAIHPAQISPIHECLTPTAAEVAAAARLVELFDEALAAGRGVAVDHEGRMIDEAAVRAARDTLDAAGGREPTR